MSEVALGVVIQGLLTDTQLRGYFAIDRSGLICNRKTTNLRDRDTFAGNHLGQNRHLC